MSTVKDMARIVAGKQGLTRTESEQFVTAMFDLLKSTLNTGDQVKVKGLGTFKVQTVKPRSSINVNTGERVIIDSHEKITFTPDKALAESVNKPFGHFETVVLNDGVVFDDMEDSFDNAPTAVPVKTDDIVGDEPTTETVAVTASSVSPVAEQGADDDDKTEGEVAHDIISFQGGQPAVGGTVVRLEPQKSDIVNDESAQEAYIPKTPEVKASALVEPVTDSVLHAEEPDTEEKEKIVRNVTAEKSSNKMLYVLFGAVLAVFFIVGFFAGRMTNAADGANSAGTSVTRKKTVVRRVIVKVPSKPVVAKKADTLKAEEPNVVISELKAAEPKKKQEETITAYDSDPRVRTGAYRITGVDKTVTVAKGETLESLSRRYLGSGMECYVEAINGGLKEVKEGQKIKIPSLKIKRKKQQ